MGNRKTSTKQIGLEFVVGVFFIISVTILAFITMVLRLDSDKKMEVQRIVQFENIAGLQRGDKVLLRGVEIGQVSRLDMYDSYNVRVTVMLRDHHQFYEGYVAQIRNSSVLGGRYIYMEFGDETSKEIPKDAILIGQPTVDVIDTIGKLTYTLNKTIIDFDDLLNMVKKDGTTINRLFTSDDLYLELQETLKTVNESVKVFNKTSGEVSTSLKLANSTAISLDGASKSLTTAGNSVTKAMDDINRLLSNMSTKDSSLSKLLHNEQFHEDLQQVVHDLAKVSKTLQNENSTVSQLLHDDGKLYRDAESALKEVNEISKHAEEVMAKITNKKGTIGKLINDDTLYDESVKTVKSVQNAVDDLREQTPGVAFASYLLGTL
ncbi:MAG: MlaD family protein [Lentisphaeria bacterium]|nr:MlaD family protein [Lentisphaeria bacterium]